MIISKFKESTINGRISNQLKHQIDFLIDLKRSESFNQIIEEYYEIIFDALFDGSMKANDHESSKICFQVAVDIGNKLNSLNIAKTKDFQLSITKQTLKLANYFGEQKLEANNQYFSCFKDFLRNYTRYVKTSCSKSGSFLLKPCLDLIISLLKIEHINFSAIEQLFRTENFFNLANYTNECYQITTYLFRIIFLNETIKDLNSVIDSFIDKVKIFKKVVENMQPILFEKSICIPIEENIPILQKPYEKHLISFHSLIHFDLYPKDNTPEMERLKKVLDITSSENGFESFQADVAEPWWCQPAAFYLSFFAKLNSSFNARPKLVEYLEPSIFSILEKIKQKNQFFDNFLNPNGGVLVNLKILSEFTNSLFLAKNIEFAKIINKLIEIWIFIKDQEIDDNNQIQTDHYITTVGFHYPEQLANYAEKIWDYYFIDKSKTFAFTVTAIFPYSFDAFREKISGKYHEKCLKDLDFVIDNYGMLYAILTKIPDYFLKQGLNNIRLFELCNFTQSNRNKKSTADIQMMYLIYSLNTTLKEKNLYSDDLFINRKLIANYQYYIKNSTELPAGIESNYILTMICNYYKLISLNHSKDETESLIFDLIELVKTSPPKYILFKTIEEICLHRNRLDLLISNKESFHPFRNEAEIKDLIQSIFDLIEGRNLEVIDTNLKKNIQTVNRVESNVDQTTKTVNVLTKQVKKQEINITNINSGIKNINVKLDEFGEVIEEQDTRIEEVNNKTVSNVPKWAKEICKLLDKDWILIAKRLNFNIKDIKAWSTQSDPCMCMLQEWFITNKTSDAISGIIKCLKEANKTSCIKIIESSIDSADPNNNLDDSILDTQLIENPPEVFVSFEWSSMEKALLLKKYLDDLKFINVWFDDGKMGGGNLRNNRIDIGLRKCQVLICLITSEASKDETCLNQINLAVQLGKPIIPLLLDSKLKWPPSGSLGPILSEYLFIRFFQRPKEVTNDERYWPVDKFSELLMQLKCLIPSNDKTIQNDLLISSTKSPEVFISYQWDKQPQIIKLFNKFQSIGINCWLDIYQMGGGDSLYDKIDRGLRNCLLVISCVTLKYSLSANCRKEIALADSISKPIIPILLESINYPPSGPMSPTLSVLKYIDFTKDLNEQETWNGDSFKELLKHMKPHLPIDIVENTTSKACVIS